MRKVMIVTGGSSGIGRAICELATDYDVILCYCSNMKNATNLLNKNTHIKEIYKIDISNESEVIKFKNYVFSKYNKIDVLVNNAGIAIDTLFEDKTVDEFKKVIDINLIGTFLMSKHIGQEMFNKKEGNIINISSTNGMDTYYPMSIDYDASKAGVISLTKNLAVQFSPFIRVNSIAPGWINRAASISLLSKLFSISVTSIGFNLIFRILLIKSKINSILGITRYKVHGNNPTFIFSCTNNSSPSM